MKCFTTALLLVLTFASNLVAQQKQGAWWYFGVKAGLNFNAEPPVPDYAGQSLSDVGSASISDANGNLLFIVMD